MFSRRTECGAHSRCPKSGAARVSPGAQGESASRRTGDGGSQRDTWAGFEPLTPHASAPDVARWARFYMEPVDDGTDGVAAAVRATVGSAP